jgi:hypothetical protein
LLRRARWWIRVKRVAVDRMIVVHQYPQAKEAVNRSIIIRKRRSQPRLRQK